MGKIVKLKDSQLEIREVEKKFKQWKRNKNLGASYRVGTDALEQQLFSVGEIMCIIW
jgi:hypothetical protein